MVPRRCCNGVPEKLYIGRELLVELEDGPLHVRLLLGRHPVPPHRKARDLRPARQCRGRLRRFDHAQATGSHRPRRAPSRRTLAAGRLSSPLRATVASSRCLSSSFVMSALLLGRLRVRRFRTYRTEVGSPHSTSAANRPLRFACTRFAGNREALTLNRKTSPNSFLDVTAPCRNAARTVRPRTRTPTRAERARTEHRVPEARLRSAGMLRP